MGERLAERLDSCLLTDEQGNARLQPGQLAGELLQRSHEQREQRAARLAWGSPRGARPDANHSNTSIDVATLSHPIAEDVRKASKERRSEIEYAYPRPPKFEAVPNKFKLMRSMGRIISLACPPNKDQQRKREQRKREEIHAEVVAKFERQLAGRLLNEENLVDCYKTLGEVGAMIQSCDALSVQKDLQGELEAFKQKLVGILAQLEAIRRKLS